MVGGRFLRLVSVLVIGWSAMFHPVVSFASPEDDERCRQDTERYNAAWTAAWYATHPGQGPAPTPTPPYVCPPPPPDTPTTPTNPTPVTPNKPIVPGTAQGTGLPNELENKPGNTPELNTGLGKPGEYKPGYDPATGLPVNGAEQAVPNQPTYDTNNPLAPQPMQTPEPFRPDLETPAPNPDTSKWIVPPAEEPHLPQATLPTEHVKPPAPHKPEIVPDKPDNGSLNPVQKQPAEKIAPKEQKPPAKHFSPCMATNTGPMQIVNEVIAGGSGTPYSPPVNGVGATDLGFEVTLNGKQYMIPGDTFAKNIGYPGSIDQQPPLNKAFGQKYDWANYLVPLDKNGNVDIREWNRLKGSGHLQGQPSMNNPAFKPYKKLGNVHRLLPGGTVDTGKKNEALVLLTPIEDGRDPKAAGPKKRGVLFAVSMDKHNKPHWRVVNNNLPRGVSNLSGATQTHGGTDQETTYFATDSIGRDKGITNWRAKDMSNTSTWQWQDSKGKWHSYKTEPDYKTTINSKHVKPGKNLGEVDMKQLKDGSWVETYTDPTDPIAPLKMRQAKTPGGLASAPEKNVTPAGSAGSYAPIVHNPRGSYPNNLDMRYSQWNGINYSISRMHITGNCK